MEYFTSSVPFLVRLLDRYEANPLALHVLALRHVFQPDEDAVERS